METPFNDFNFIGLSIPLNIILEPLGNMNCNGEVRAITLLQRPILPIGSIKSKSVNI